MAYLWRNPGASGLGSEINWILPDGIEAAEIQWPTPHRIELGGLLTMATRMKGLHCYYEGFEDPAAGAIDSYWR